MANKSNKNVPAVSKNVSRKPATPEVKATVVVEDDVPALPTDAPKAAKTKRPKLDARTRVNKRVHAISKRMMVLATRIGLDADDIKALDLALKVACEHVSALPQDWRPAGGTGIRSERTPFAKGDIVALKPKFIAEFVDEDTSEADLEKLSIFKIFGEGKRLAVVTPGGDKILLNVSQVRRAA